jgi:pimeloyl-ACP methyl ester carboxylesterase
MPDLAPIDDIPGTLGDGAITPPPADNGRPTATIVKPATHVRIKLGEQVSFSGSGTSNNLITGHQWYFDGAAAPATSATPGLITFTKAGSYRVVYTVIDDQGAIDRSIVYIFVSSDDSGLPQPSKVKAVHRSGQTFVTWQEDSTLGGERYRIYRHTAPITAANIAQAIPLATVEEGSSAYSYEIDRTGSPIGQERYIIDDTSASQPGLGKQLSTTTGLFVYTNPEKTAGTFYYAVTTVSAAGAENRSAFSVANAPPTGVKELAATPRPVLVYVTPGLKGRVYTQFMDYQAWNPRYEGYAYNFSLILPPGHDQAGSKTWPVLVQMEGWGSRYDVSDSFYDLPTIYLRMDDNYQTWYFGFGDNIKRTGAGANATWYPGAVVNFAEHRITAAIRAVLSDPTIRSDSQRVYAVGHSMGGTGALRLGMRYPEIFAGVVCSQPMIDMLTTGNGGIDWLPDVVNKWGPAATNAPLYLLRSSNPAANGLLRYSGTKIYDWQNAIWELQHRAQDEMAFLSLGQGMADTTLSWTSQGVPFYPVLNSAGRGFAYLATDGGHHWMGFIKHPMMFEAEWDEWFMRRDLSFPGLSKLQDTQSGALVGLGSDVVWSAPWNNWDKDPEDTATSWAISLRTTGTNQLVDVTPRRLQQLKVTDGETYAYTVTALGSTTPLKSGTVVAQGSLITIPAVAVTPAGIRLRIERK